MSKFVNTIKYATIVKADTEYGRRMRHLANRIFGEVTRPTTTQSMKVVQMMSEEPLYLRDNVINYYPRHLEMGGLTWKLREYGLFRDEHQDWKEEMRRLRTLRGKPPRRIKPLEERKLYKKRMEKLKAKQEAEAAAADD